MKITRTGNIVHWEIEPSDCPPGITTEMAADLIEKGMKNIGIESVMKVDGMILTDPSLKAIEERELKDWHERWEL
jgi:hypothetical protein